MTREEAISVLKETIDPNVDKSLKEWKEWDKEKHLPAVNMAIEALKQEPVKHGEWKADKKSVGGTMYIKAMKCSKCNRTFTIRADWNYCPNCGAKMDKD